MFAAKEAEQFIVLFGVSAAQRTICLPSQNIYLSSFPLLSSAKDNTPITIPVLLKVFECTKGNFFVKCKLVKLPIKKENLCISIKTFPLTVVWG